MKVSYLIERFQDAQMEKLIKELKNHLEGKVFKIRLSENDEWPGHSHARFIGSNGQWGHYIYPSQLGAIVTVYNRFPKANGSRGPYQNIELECNCKFEYFIDERQITEREGRKLYNKLWGL